jgi:regulatory protein
MQDKPFSKNIKPSKKPEKRREKRPPKKITPTYLHNAGLYYLQRFAASREHFRQVMIRKARKSCMHHKEQDFEDCLEMINELVDKFAQTGLLDDDSYTRAVVSSMRRAGKSRKAIMAKLRTKGLDQALVVEKLEQHAQDYDLEEPELQAALIFARKKRLGPYKTDDKKTEEQAMGALARNGFSYDTVQRVLNMSPEEANIALRA